MSVRTGLHGGICMGLNLDNSTSRNRLTKPRTAQVDRIRLEYRRKEYNLQVALPGDTSQLPVPYLAPPQPRKLKLVLYAPVGNGVTEM